MIAWCARSTGCTTTPAVSARGSRPTAIAARPRQNIPGATAEDYVNYQLVTNEEDVAVVESQRPEAVPLDLRAEMHIPADRFSIRYRRDLVEVFGLGSPSLVR